MVVQASERFKIRNANPKKRDSAFDTPAPEML